MDMSTKKELSPPLFENEITSEEKARRIDSVRKDLEEAVDNGHDFMLFCMTEDGAVRCNGGASIMHQGMFLNAMMAQQKENVEKIIALRKRDRMKKEEGNQ